MFIFELKENNDEELIFKVNNTYYKVIIGHINMTHDVDVNNIQVGPKRISVSLDGIEYKLYSDLGI